jgi:hypothetical protein
MPSIPDDMSAAAVERRAKMTEKMREEVQENAATPPAPPKPRIAKGR